ncbi:hypothetical protein H4R34_001415 [Dimargaris verticillata]|uniref:Small ribosomal subunit protein mS29 n=1 Tax=Dimargaris verticillata TaxID=2761393 RepID=A0A9W8BAU1_9FUNG|nr:hypothetical protein H4R34_001415 [Dimargaris verticillata]
MAFALSVLRRASRWPVLPGAVRTGPAKPNPVFNPMGGQQLHTAPLLQYPPKEHTQTKSRAFRKVQQKKPTTLDFSGPSKEVEDENIHIKTEYHQDPVFADIPELTTDNITHDSLHTIYALPRELIGKFTAQDFPDYLYRDFSTVHSDGLMVREPFCRLASLMEARTTPQPLVLTGRTGVGKSATLLQAASYAHLKQWLILYVPNAIHWVDSSQPYRPSADPSAYLQPEVARRWLQFIRQINASVLNSLVLPTTVTVGNQTLAKGSSVDAMLAAGIDQPAAAHDAVEALLQFSHQGLGAPVLMAVDQLNAFYISTEYFTPENERLLPANLRLVRAFLPFFDGQKSLKDGLVLGALSMANTQFRVPGFGLEGRVTKGKEAMPMAAKPLEVPAFDKHETQALLEFYHQSGVVYHKLDDALVAKRWVLTNGNAADLLAYALKNTNVNRV